VKPTRATAVTALTGLLVVLACLLVDASSALAAGSRAAFVFPPTDATKVGTSKPRDVSVIATAPSHATFIYPANGSTAVDTSKGFSWASAPSAQAYYLVVGTSKGARDVLDSGTLSATTTSYPVPALPVGPTLWARLWTEVSGSWAYYQDISFQVSISASRLTYPASGQTTVDTRKPFTWLSAPDGQAYYLHVGTSPGAADLVDSGSTTKTSWSVPPLPIGQILFARIYTEINGSWSTYTQISFTVSYSSAVLSNPVPAQNSPNQDTARPFTWASLPGASAYYVWIGTSIGAKDVAESGPLPSSQASYLPRTLPTGAPLWVRLWTLASGTWIHSADVSFTPAARIITPAQRSITVDPSHPFSWTPGAVIGGKSPTYELTIGTQPGGKDLYDSGSVATTSLTVPRTDLPTGEALYARVVVKLGDGSQRPTDTVFAIAGSNIHPAQLSWGAAGSEAVDTSQPFTWDATDLAQAYRLEISDGSSDAVDSGPIHVSEYFAEELPPGGYTAQLGTELAGVWSWTTSSFSVVSDGSVAANEIAAAHWATDYVRHMADLSGYAYQWSDLWQYTNAQWPRVMTTCGVYALELLNVLRQMNVAGSLPASEQPRSVSIAFLADDADDHVIDYFWDSDDADWIVLDPTFDIAMQRSSDGHWATAQDAHNATVAKNWPAITYVPLGDFGFSIARAYYVDYPLLYLNVPETSVGSGADPTPYLDRVTTWPVGNYDEYLAQSNENPIQLIIDGQSKEVDTDAVGGYFELFAASSVALPLGDTDNVTLYTAPRNVFWPAAAGPRDSGSATPTNAILLLTRSRNHGSDRKAS
jgi:hypothetical protein